MANQLKQYVDVLLVSALEEECFVLEKWFLDDKSPKNKNRPIYKTYEHYGLTLNLALADLGGMGNVWAMAATLRLIDELCPRFLILFGLAGGNSKLVRRGDVVYSTEIGYSSFSKIDSKSLKKVLKQHWDVISRVQSPTSTRSKYSYKSFVSKFQQAKININKIPSGININLRKPKTKDIPNIFSEACDKLVNSPQAIKDWQDKASLWFGDSKEAFAVMKHSDDKTYGSQNAPENNPPLARGALIASGEAIVANSEYRNSIDALYEDLDKQKKKKTKVGLYEMEAFGFATACEMRGVPFGVVKGVSDLAGIDKTSKHEADAYRLAAIASSSAFVYSLLKQLDFLLTVRNNLNHSSWHQKSCIWTEGKYGCGLLSGRQNENAIFSHERPCITTENAPQRIKTQEVLKNRLFENVHARVYSEWLATAMKDPKSKVILLYPYTIRELITFIDNKKDSRLVNNISDYNRLYDQKVRNLEENKQLASLAMEIGAHGKIQYQHLSDGDRICADMILHKKDFLTIANRICRVVFIQDRDLKEMQNNPAWLLHLAICGICVPTFIATSRVVGDFFADEATFIKSPEGKVNSIIHCLMYAEKSRLLTLLGRCEPLGENAKSADIFDLARDVFKHLSICKTDNRVLEGLTPSRYNVFPCTRLLENHNHQPIDLFPIQVKSESDNATISNYFMTLKQYEITIT